MRDAGFFVKFTATEIMRNDLELVAAIVAS